MSGRFPNTLVFHPKVELYRDLLGSTVPGLSAVIARDDQDLQQALPDAEILLCTHLSREQVSIARKLRWIQLTSAGVEGLLPVRDQLRQVKITNARGIHAELMADHAIAAMIMLQWDFPRILRDQAARHWRREPKEALAGKTLGVIGAGAIGGEIGRRAWHFGMQVLGVRRSGGDLPGFNAVFGREQLDHVLSQCDFVCLTVPATEETWQMIGAAQLRAMKRSVFLVNISRGSVIDEIALVAALQDGTIAGAALDVFAKEPPDQDNPLWTLPNVIITPHISGMLDTNEQRLVSIFAENLQRYRAGEPLINAVDLARGY